MPARDELLDSLVRYAGAHGIAHASLRQIAAGTGTSHRMLIHHFGSKDGVLVAVVREVESRQRQTLQEVVSGGRFDIATFWERFADPELAAFERLFFELYGQALQGQPWAAPLLHNVHDWLEPVADALRTASVEADTAEARLAIAVTRGLLLDLLATGDQEDVHAAMRRFIGTQYRAEHRK